MLAIPALASMLDEGSDVDVEVLMELTQDHFLVRHGWPGRRMANGLVAIVHRSKLVARNNEAVLCLTVSDRTDPVKVISRSAA